MYIPAEELHEKQSIFRFDFIVVLFLLLDPCNSYIVPIAEAF